ncbi:hypothetical protein [Devriesea agamarum]|uniref:hypothetical protein n=1 Tax=Devriesea agamarum TaxID=472569 RepID=UPI00071E6321|nr:hypothetical protein [Devriesea agamarum]
MSNYYSECAREPWRADATWVWNDKNKRMRKAAPLRAHLCCSESDIQTITQTWLNQFERSEGGTWFDGGVEYDLLKAQPDQVILEICSGGEDAFESVKASASRLFDEVVTPHSDIRVSWEEMPLRAR